MIKRLIAWVVADFHARRRHFDLAVLWPSCCELAPDLDHAKAAFAYHAYNDSSWQALGDAEIYRQIDALKPPKN